MHDERVRIGILGAGMIATSPTGVVPNLAKVADGVEVRAIASRTRSVTNGVAATSGVPIAALKEMCCGRARRSSEPHPGSGP